MSENYWLKIFVESDFVVGDIEEVFVQMVEGFFRGLPYKKKLQSD